jgi:hypothetical protein
MKSSLCLTTFLFVALSHLLNAQEYSLMKINQIKSSRNESAINTKDGTTNPPQNHEDSTSDNSIDSSLLNVNTSSSLTSFVNGRLLAPTVNIGGSNFSKKGNFLGSALLFKSAISDKIEDSAQLRTHLFSPDASIFGFSGNVLLMFSDKRCASDTSLYSDSKKHILFRGQFHFLQKRLYLPDSTKIEPYFFHFRAGFEYMPVSDWISFYANFSFATPLTEIPSFQKATGYYSTSYFFFDYGLKCNLRLTDNSNVNLDLNFVGVTSTIRQISGTRDLVIPSIRIGISQDIVTKKK